MSKPLEVRANTSFGRFRQGRIYEVDIDDDRMMSLLGVGYLEPTSIPEGDDGDDGRDRDAELAAGGDGGGAAVPDHGSRESSEAEGLADGDDRVESGGDSAHRASKRVRGGKTSGVKDSGRGADSGEVGNA